MTIEEALKHEPVGRLPLSHPTSVQVGTSLTETLRIMKAEGVGCVLVCEEERLRGIFTERDVLNKLFGRAFDGAAPVERYMTPDPETLRPADTLGDAIRLMTQKGYRHVPLLDARGRSAGLIAASDVVHYIAEHFPAEVVNLPPRLHQHFATPEGA